MRNEELIVSHMNYARKLAQTRRKAQGIHINTADLESEAVFGLMKAGVRFDSSLGHKFVSYVHCRIVGSLSDFLEKQNQRSFADLEDVHQVESAEYQRALQSDTRRVVKAAVSSLPAREHDIIVMRFWFGLSHDKIGRSMKVSYGRVWQLEQRAMERLREYFAVRNLELKAFV